MVVGPCGSSPPEGQLEHYLLLSCMFVDRRDLNIIYLAIRTQTSVDNRIVGFANVRIVAGMVLR